MSLQLIGQILVNGLFSGAIYVLIATGFTLIFGIMRLVNFAHGEFYMIGAFCTYVLIVLLKLPFFIAVFLAIVFAAAIGFILERVLFRPLHGLELQGMIMALAIGIALQSAALLIFGPQEVTVPRVVTGAWSVAGIVIAKDRSLVALISAIILVMFYLFMKKTQTGLAIDAVSQDHRTASLMGIPTRKMQSLAFVLGTGLAAFAGALMAPIYDVGPYMGEVPMLKAFIVVIIGGLGSIPGAAIGGLLLGLFESIFATFYTQNIAMIFSFSFVVILLLYKPLGLLGKAS
ncbi:branched-chain amino acid ABC transporter permease [Pusillimonas sp. ANT_WB101]|uniref:branched-chain amino acid ABC transporter permease n=1 Tax=Pusillimonas sp. ANT_WB101 TaxID=2597356 RepID=UPI0011ED59C7|nr:branched-chain amino acid ABC transporter permease [Pusillimonas sp. ANT_WB101]KAA0892639.1 branched-chain amino acid ABC transporter permease [Pusillimonas sp. ANT_WB101]